MRLSRSAWISLSIVVIATARLAAGPASLSAVLSAVALAEVEASAEAEPGASNIAAPTFSKDIAPVLYNRCAECHRPGAMAPMALLTYEDVRPWAKAIKAKVVKREMPPWGADPRVGRFANDPSLSQAQIDMIAAWADAGAPEGRRADLPPVPHFTEGWSIGKPDHIFTMLQPFKVPADGTVPYVYITIPTHLKEDIWIRGVELKPTDRRVVHHIISDLIEGDGKPVDPAPKPTRDRTRKEVGGGLGGLVPGRLYGLYEEGVARKIPAGADIVLQMHYTTIGEPVTDQTQIGVVLAKEPPTRLRAGGGGQIPNASFAIPAGHANYEVVAKQIINRDTYLSTMYPHMHVRGKDVSCSKANPFNPDPTATVRWGEQTWEEMLIGYYGTIEIETPKK